MFIGQGMVGVGVGVGVGYGKGGVWGRVGLGMVWYM